MRKKVQYASGSELFRQALSLFHNMTLLLRETHLVTADILIVSQLSCMTKHLPPTFFTPCSPPARVSSP